MFKPAYFGLAGGLVWGLTTFLFTWICIYNGFGVDWLAVLSSIYPGYEITPIGSIVGFLYSFWHGFITLFLVALLYNRLGWAWTT